MDGRTAAIIGAFGRTLNALHMLKVKTCVTTSVEDEDLITGDISIEVKAESNGTVVTLSTSFNVENDMVEDIAMNLYNILKITRSILVP